MAPTATPAPAAAAALPNRPSPLDGGEKEVVDWEGGGGGGTLWCVAGEVGWCWFWWCELPSPEGWGGGGGAAALGRCCRWLPASVAAAAKEEAPAAAAAALLLPPALLFLGSVRPSISVSEPVYV